MWNLTLYTKPSCSLCESAKQSIKEFSKECALTLHEVDISKDPALWDEYQYDIPVLLIHGKEAARHHIGLPKLRVLRQRWEQGKGLPQRGKGIFPAEKPF